MIFNEPDHIEFIRNGLLNIAPCKRIIKTQTRRPNRGIYKVGRSYAVQRKRGVKAEPDIRIVMDKIWLENGGIFHEDALAEGGYTPAEFEEVFYKIYPRCGIGRWAFTFHVVKTV